MTVPQRLSGLVLALTISSPVTARQAAPPLAQPPPPAADQTNAAPTAAVSTVTVTAPRFEQVPDLIEKFAFPDGRGRLARWEEPVCPTVRGLPAALDQVIAQRIRDTATAAKIPVGGPHCGVNIAVLITRTPKVLAASLVQRRRSVLEGDSRWPFDRSRGEALVASDAPVRWWYVSRQVGTDGGKAFTQGDFGQVAAYSFNNLFGPPTFNTGGASLLRPTTEDAFSRVIIIVDANKIVGLDLAQVSGYVAMVSLAQIKPDADLGNVTSIMNVFADHDAGKAAPSDLTFWDRAYIGGLYDTDAQVNFSQQMSHIATHIRHDVAVHNVLPLSATAGKGAGG